MAAISNWQGAEQRQIHQFHFTNWPIHTQPFSNALLDFRRRVRTVCQQYSSKHSNLAPLIVHCSDGCGRTGTYLAIDANLELAEEEAVYDVLAYTRLLRSARKGMVESMVGANRHTHAEPMDVHVNSEQPLRPNRVSIKEFSKYE